ncbi:hypothetical protein Ancab_023804 [Ancistrocladus abbreviatus]
MSTADHGNSCEGDSGLHTGGSHLSHDASKSEEQRWRRRGRKECSRIARTQCSFPLTVIFRLLSLVKKCHGGKRNVIGSGGETFGLGGGGERECLGDGNCCESPGPRGVLEGCGDSLVHDVSGLQMREHNVNLAAGHGLLSLIAAAKSELDQMTDLRRQMEMFLQNLREEYHRKQTISRTKESEIAYPPNISEVDLNNICNPSALLDRASPLSQTESGVTMACDLLANCNTVEKEGCVEGMKYLEGELEAELERLQLGLNTKESCNLQQQIAEMSVMETNGSFSEKSEVVVDPLEVRNVEGYGVSPYELERRLHDLLEARQEERIRELETHLESVKQKLTEKEIEVAWWKNTARLISENVPESSQFLR